MLYNTLAVYVSAYSVLAILLLVAHFYCKWQMGLRKYNEVINGALAGKKKTILFGIYSYSITIAWLVFALPFLDLVTFRWFTEFQDHGILTYFGSLSDKTANFYFLLIFFNILGVKAALNLGEAALLLHKGRVRLIPTKFGMIWAQE